MMMMMMMMRMMVLVVVVVVVVAELVDVVVVWMNMVADGRRRRLTLSQLHTLHTNNSHRSTTL